MLDLNHPFFKPLWVRIAVTVFCLAWGVYEFATGSPFWGVLFCGVGLVCIYGFFMNFNPRDEIGRKRDG